MKKNKMNTKLIIIIGVMTVLSAYCGAGAGNRVEVRIEAPNPGVVNLDKYDKIVYKDLTLNSIPGGLNPGKTIRTFFLDDFSKAALKNVEIWNDEKHGEGKTPPSTLLLTGTLTLDIKERSKIVEKKDETGKKKKSFVNVQHWSMNLSVTMKNAADGTEVFNGTFEEKLADVDPANTKFNFDNLFFKISNQLANKLTKTKRIERRYLLL